MSEYQYYEFLALDRPLTKAQREELRSISSRAKITAREFISEYQWGDLQGDPREMTERYFDAFMYWANFGTRQLMLRLPRGTLTTEAVKPFVSTEAFSVIETGSYVILSFQADRDPDGWEDEEPEGELADIAQVRSELAAGDLRPLYLGWLLALQTDFSEVDDEDVEPPVPAGLEDLSAPLKAIVDFLGIDEGLIAVAAEGAPSAGRTAAQLWRAASERGAAREKAGQ
jgi:hypothetical protein